LRRLRSRLFINGIIGSLRLTDKKTASTQKIANKDFTAFTLKLSFPFFSEILTVNYYGRFFEGFNILKAKLRS
jgi:hypothetical protein